MRRCLTLLIVLVLTVPLLLASLSPLLAGRSWPYVIGGLAGVVGFSLLFVQPLLAAGLAWQAPLRRQRRWHRVCGALLFLAVIVHVAGLYLASPPDMLDALLLVAPAPFSLYGVMALWALLLIVATLVLRRQARFRLRLWKWIHLILGVVIVLASVIHAWMIDGAMNTSSKQITSVLICLALVLALSRVWHLRRRSGGRQGQQGGHRQDRTGRNV